MTRMYECRVWQSNKKWGKLKCMQDDLQASMVFLHDNDHQKFSQKIIEIFERIYTTSQMHSYDYDLFVMNEYLFKFCC